MAITSHAHLMLTSCSLHSIKYYLYGNLTNGIENELKMNFKTELEKIVHNECFSVLLFKNKKMTMTFAKAEKKQQIQFENTKIE